MAETYYYTVTSGTFTRSNADGGQTTFVKGETLESDDPELATRKKNLEPITPGKLPSPAGFIPKRVQVEIASTTVAAATARQAAESAGKAQVKPEDEGEPKSAKAAASKVPVRSTDPHAVTEKG